MPTKRDLLEMVKVVREHPLENAQEDALNLLTEDLGFVEVLCRMLTQEQLDDLNNDEVLW